LHECFDFQMDLSSKFRMISACEQIKISALKQNAPYPIERAERVQTKYGETFLATLRAESPQTFLKYFYPDVMGFCSVMKNYDT